MNLFNRLLLTTTLVTLAACPSSEEEKGIAIGDAPAAIATAVCDSVPRCEPGGVASFHGVDCKVVLTTEVRERMLPLFEEAVAAGRMVYDGEALASCLESLATSCVAFDGAYPACLNVGFVGQVAVDDECSIDHECASGTCEDSEACPSKCVARGAAGATCGGSDRDCAIGLACQDGVCAAPVAAGGSCSSDTEKLACTAGSICVGELASATCVSVENLFTAELGAECKRAAGPMCKPGLACRMSVVESVGTCIQPLAEGENCTLGGFPDECGAELYCAADLDTFAGTCQPLPAEGEPCRDRDFYYQPCAAGFVCAGENTCTAGKANGEACTSSSECFGDLCEEGKCAARSCEPRI